MFADGIDASGKPFNGGKNVLLQYEKNKGWQKYRKCSFNPPIANFRLPTSYGNIPPENQSVLEQIFVAPLRGLFELFGFGTGASATTGVKIPSDLLNTPVYLNFEGCPGLALSTVGKDKCGDFSTVDAVNNTGVNQTWEIIPIEITGITDKIPRYCIRSSARKNHCDRTYLSVKMNCTDHRVDLWMSRLDKTDSESNLPVVWRAFGGNDNIFTFDNEWRIQKGCNFKVLSLQQCGLSNNLPPKVSLVEPNSTGNKRIKITAAAAGPPAAAARGVSTQSLGLKGPDDKQYKRLTASEPLPGGETTKFIFKKPGADMYLHNGPTTGSNRVDVMWYSDINNYCIWRVRGEGDGYWSLSPWDNDRDKNFMGAIQWDEDKSVLPDNFKSRSCSRVDVSKRWDFASDNAPNKWQYNGRYRWKFVFGSNGLVKLMNEAAEKSVKDNKYTHGTFTDIGCRAFSKYLNINQYPAKLSAIGTEMEVYYYK
jgi:hypothetical protein